jgi:hypothetical protein
MYTWEFINRPVDPIYYGNASVNANECEVRYKNERVGKAINSFWAQKIVDALNKADAS